MPGSFYVLRKTSNETLTHTYLYIDYSIDTAATFITYFHDLGDYVGIEANTESNQENSLECFPNPVSGNLKINIGLKKSISHNTLEVYNLSGDILYSEKLNSINCSLVIPTNTWENGIYFLTIKTNNRIELTRRVIILK